MATDSAERLTDALIKGSKKQQQPSVAPPKRKGRVPLTPEQREKRKAELLAEPKDAKFRRLVNHRMPRLLKCIRSITALANRSQYEFTQEQFVKINNAIVDSITVMANKFNGNKDNGATFAL